MTPGQRVRVRAASHIAQRKDLPAEAQGTVLCCYKILGRSAAPERVDVQFSGSTIMWGVSAAEFEAVDDTQGLACAS